MSFILGIILFYYVFCFLFLSYTYYVLKKYYRHIKYKEKETGKEVDIQEKFAPLVPLDHLNYFSFVFIGIVVFPIRLILVYLTYHCLIINLKILKLIYKNHEANEKQHQKLERAAHFWFSIYFFINNISVEKKEDINYKDIYKKYLGENYDFSQKDFSLYISNHLGALEISTYIREYGLSFLITHETLRSPGVGPAYKELGSFFIIRESAESRKKALDILLKRQNDFYNKKSYLRTLVFPEGTTTNGKYIATFKKGAFISLLPVKPLIVFYYDGLPCSTNRFFFFIRTTAEFKIKIIYAELPVIKPTDYMFEKYKDLGKEKWEIYANVVNKIYSEIGGLKQCNIRYRDRSLYYQIAEDGFYIDK